MKSTKLLSSLLALLGFQMQSCIGDLIGSDEYGCPYTTFKTNGTVKDENGHNIQNAKVHVNIDGVVSNTDSTGTTTNDTVSHLEKSGTTNRSGVYDIRVEGEGVYHRGATLHYEVITEKDGYESDTTHNQVKREDLSREKGKDDWETILSHGINVTIKKK